MNKLYDDIFEKVLYFTPIEDCGSLYLTGDSLIQLRLRRLVKAEVPSRNRRTDADVYAASIENLFPRVTAVRCNECKSVHGPAYSLAFISVKCDDCGCTGVHFRSDYLWKLDRPCYECFRAKVVNKKTLLE